MAVKILIVDDEPNILNALERVLRRDSYDIITAQGGRDALAALDKHDDIAVIICDQRMPDIDGAQVLKEARFKCPEMVRIALTGYADMDTILQCINEARVTQFILKPWDDEALLQVVCESVTIHGMKEWNLRLQQMAQEQNSKLQELNASLEKKVSERTSDLATAHEKIEKALQDIVEVLAELMEMHALDQRGHGKRVARLSRRIAEVLKRPPDEVALIDTAALCHDIGKIAVPPDLLSMPTHTLKKNEREIIKRHTVAGYEILRKINGFDEIAEIVRHHHESFSGQGYPDKLAAIDIPLGSRIIAVADMFDHEIFPSGKTIIGSQREAQASLLRAGGNSLDPGLVDIFLDSVLPEYKDLDFREVETTINKLQPGMVLSRDITNINRVPLLKAGTKLDDEVISKLTKMEEFDPALSRIFVEGGTIPNAQDFIREAEEENAVPVEMPGPPAVEEMLRVVVVDDQPEIVGALRRELKAAGYEAKGFIKVQDAMRYIRSEKNIFALITDFMMPGICGDKFLAEVQKERPNLPCIVITGAATKDTIYKLSKSVKVTRILPKPWDKNELLGTLEKFKTSEPDTDQKTEEIDAPVMK
jgi:putative nucleotidyltransferase with HDIG domain